MFDNNYINSLFGINKCKNIQQNNILSFKSRFSQPLKDEFIKTQDKKASIIGKENENYNTHLKNLYNAAYQGCGYKFKSDKDFEVAFKKAIDYANKQNNFEEAFEEKLKTLSQNISQKDIMERINSGNFPHIGTDFKEIIFEDIDLSKYDNAFNYITFDSRTFKNVSPQNLPKGFNPLEILEKGKSIGLGIDQVHKMGYTGSGISYAIIDTGVKPHKDICFKEYHVAESSKNIPWLNNFHGSAVSYIAQEIAPNANCYYFATNNGSEMDKPILESLKSILERNKTLPESEKIRFVSMSMPLYGGEETKEIIRELEKQGVWVYYSGCPEDYKFGYLEKINPSGDPNDFNNYQIASGEGGNLYVNSGNRTVADPSSPVGYRHDVLASKSWSIPVIAGYYTLACQADSSMTKEKFMKLAEETAQIKQSTKPNWICVGDNENDENAWRKQGRKSELVEIKIIDIRALLQAIEDKK